jgi:hypothetical protein
MSGCCVASPTVGDRGLNAARTLPRGWPTTHRTLRSLFARNDQLDSENESRATRSAAFCQVVGCWDRKGRNDSPLSTPWPTRARSVFFADTASAPTRAKAVKDGRIRRIATGAWTADMSSTIEEIVAANVLTNVARRVGPSAPVDVADPAALNDSLRARHQTFMAGRPTMRPGQFKDRTNFLAGIEFVPPNQIEGSLHRAFHMAENVPAGFARAAYMMIVVAEVHPFHDGNGRAARLMMNAELSAAELRRIVVPTVIRNEYMFGLRKFAKNGRVDAVAKMLLHCWRWTHSVP